MPSASATILRGLLRVLKPIITRQSLEKMRASHDLIGKLSHSRTLYSDFKIGDIPASFVKPSKTTPDNNKVMLYLHGGAYVAGNLCYAKRFSGQLAEKMNMNVLCIAYSLAPEKPYPAALCDAEAAYRHLLSRGYDPKNITLIGESAGGGLLLALTHKLIADNEPLPGRLIPISPWTDLTLSGGSYTYNEKNDYTLSTAPLQRYVLMYADGKLSEPFVSPLFGDFHGFPETLIFAGRDELLYDDAKSLYEKMIKQDTHAEFIAEEKMWHAYVLYGLPESKRAMQKIKEFLSR